MPSGESSLAPGMTMEFLLKPILTARSYPFATAMEEFDHT